jgi:hypothetical protein
MNEPIQEVVGDVYLKKGLLTKNTFRLVFTDERVIFVHATKAMIKEEQKDFAAELKGKKFKERLGAMLHARERTLEKYKDMSLEELLKQGEVSFELPYSKIKKVKRHISAMDDDSVSDDASRVTIKTDSEKIKCSFSDERASSKTYKILKKAIK